MIHCYKRIKHVVETSPVGHYEIQVIATKPASSYQTYTIDR